MGLNSITNHSLTFAKPELNTFLPYLPLPDKIFRCTQIRVTSLSQCMYLGGSRDENVTNYLDTFKIACCPLEV